MKSYASSVLGWQYGWKLTNSGLPLQISAGNKLNCGWSFNFTQSGGSADVSYDMFLHAIQMPGTNDTPTDEIMIWLYTANGAAPTGTKQATVTIDSASWDLYRGTTTWNVFSYVRTANATSAVINVMDFMNDLVTRGWVQSSKYLTSVQSGTEIFTGTGRARHHRLLLPRSMNFTLRPEPPMRMNSGLVLPGSIFALLLARGGLHEAGQRQRKRHGRILRHLHRRSDRRDGREHRHAAARRRAAPAAPRPAAPAAPW